MKKKNIMIRVQAPGVIRYFVVPPSGRKTTQQHSLITKAVLPAFARTT